MSTLANGIELMELGSTAWRVVINNNFSAVYTKAELDSRVVAVTTTQDHTFLTDTKGVVLKDRTAGTYFRLYVDGGVLSIEAV